MTRLNEALALYQQLEAADSRPGSALLRAAGSLVRHWRQANRDKPAFGWASLTETERRVAHLAAKGLSNRQIAGQMFLSVHTIAFHLRRIFCKLDLTSRVQPPAWSRNRSARTAMARHFPRCTVRNSAPWR